MTVRLSWFFSISLGLASCGEGTFVELDDAGDSSVGSAADGGPNAGEGSGASGGRSGAGSGGGPYTSGRGDAEGRGCGDGLLAADEACDDANAEDGDGCSARCTVDEGWACPVVGARCRAARCGDGIVAGYEECDDGGLEPGDGCDGGCEIEASWACGPAGCFRTVCGDGEVEGFEQCDDGPDDIPYDGCYQCIQEPVCDDGCRSVCGDGIRFPDEACDDGNRRAGDGCSPSCALEDGFACSHAASAPPSTVDIPVVFRDLRGYDLPPLPDAGIAAGHPDFEHVNAEERSLVADTLAADKKPTLAKASPNTVESAESFAIWYRDDPAYNRTLVLPLTLRRNEEGAYVFRDTSFFPLDDAGFVAEGLEPLRTGAADERGNTRHNYHFTSELRTWFEYRGGESLRFEGDDDVWVFVNGRRAVDLGGVHSAQIGTVTLDETGTDARFGLERGKIYELVLFQAERHTSRSVYQLTLRDFERARTRCVPICGDAILTRDEACDDGENLGGYGACAPGCVFGPRCGDGEVQGDQGEECDDANTDPTDACDNECRMTRVAPA